MEALNINYLFSYKIYTCFGLMMDVSFGKFILDGM